MRVPLSLFVLSLVITQLPYSLAGRRGLVASESSRSPRGDSQGTELSTWRAQLQDSDPAIRETAALALAAKGISDQQVLDELVAGMRRLRIGVYLTQPVPAYLCQAALVKLGQPAIPVLVQALAEDQSPVQALALQALGQIGPSARTAVPAIEKLLTPNDIPRMCLAAEVKWRIDGDADFTLQRMIPLLDQPSGRRCNGAVYTLAKMGRAASPALPALFSALKQHESPHVLHAISQIAPYAKDQALPGLRAAAEDSVLADDIAIVLHDLGEPSDELIKKQLTRLRDCQPNDGRNPQRIVYSIVIHGPAAKDAAGDLIDLLQHQNPEVRRAAAWGIPRVFADDQVVIKALTAAQTDPEVAEEAQKGLDMLREARRTPDR
ncbi:MAG: hypothetical protein JSS02_12985 [Planctomycetes bacterium]|nr:hypothetical protein [Planctomycetota bacterium]